MNLLIIGIKSCFGLAEFHIRATSEGLIILPLKEGSSWVTDCAGAERAEALLIRG